MLVSAAIPQSALSADDLEYGVPQEMPDPDGSKAGVSVILAPMKQPVAFSPIDQKGAYLPATQARQIAMYRPAHEHEDLLKTLYGWSTTIDVEITLRISTKTAKVGDLVEAKLSQDFRWGSRLIAAKGSLVRGHITTAQSARTLTRSAISGERTFKSKGLLAIQFDEIIDARGRRLPVCATPSPRQKFLGDPEHSSRRVIEVDKDGKIVKAELELTGGLKATSNATKVVTMVPLPGTMLFTALAPAVAMGAVGAASPSVAYDKPVDEDTDHRRMKGATYGFVSNLPGAFIVKSVVEKGSQIDLLAGDPLTLNVCIKETGAQLPPGEQLAVSGKVLRQAQAQAQTQTRRRRLYPAGM